MMDGRSRIWMHVGINHRAGIPVATGLVLLASALVAGAADVVIPASEHSARSKNVVPAETSYSGLVVCHGNGGMQQWDITVMEGGSHYIHFYYAAADSRPVALRINGKPQDGKFLARVTGGWYGDHLAWDTVGPFDLKPGKNVLQINASGCMPHLAGLIVSGNAEEWDRHAFDEQFPGLAKRTQDMQRAMASARARLREMLGTDEIVFIKRFPYTSNHYYTEYINSKWQPGGGLFILSLKDGSVRQIASELNGGVFGRFDISFDARKIVFDWKRSNGEGYRIYEVGVDGTGLRQVLAPPENEAELVAKYRLDYHNGTDDMHPCYLPDGGIAFVSTRCQTSTLCHGGDAFTTTVLYRMDADGGNLRQLSFGALSEFTPSVLPDGRILYARWEYVDKGAVAAKSIWAMRPDGTGSSEIYGNNIEFPTTMIQARPIPGVLNNYVLLGCPHYPQNALGTVVRIDMNKPIRTDKPMTYLTPEVKILSEGGWHFLDSASGRMVVDGGGQGPLYRDPWPIDTNQCLVAHKPRGFGGWYAPEGYGLYLLEAPGKVEPFYRDPEISCWQPMPLKARKRPPLIPSLIDPRLAEKGLARCVVTDVYHGLEGVERGEIRHIRVLEQIARPWNARRFGRLNADEYDQQHAVVSKDTALGLKVQHGVVPVEADGSAHFLAPANANIFLQVLDENHLAVQTERTFVNYMPGETRSCVGCHETPDAPPPAGSGTPMALTRAPSVPGPQPGEKTGRRPLHYPTDVQPVLDRRCITCHNVTDMKGGLDLSGRMTKFFSASYENLLDERRGRRQDRRRPGLVPTIGENHPKTGNVKYLPPKSLGSHNSLLIAMLAPDKVRLTGDKARLERLAKLVETHKDIRLTREELLGISNWVDTNAQYYGSYYGRRNLQDKNHPDFRPVPTWE